MKGSLWPHLKTLKEWQPQKTHSLSHMTDVHLPMFTRPRGQMNRIRALCFVREVKKQDSKSHCLCPVFFHRSMTLARSQESERETEREREGNQRRECPLQEPVPGETEAGRRQERDDMSKPLHAAEDKGFLLRSNNA